MQQRRKITLDISPKKKNLKKIYGLSRPCCESHFIETHFITQELCHLEQLLEFT